MKPYDNYVEEMLTLLKEEMSALGVENLIRLATCWTHPRRKFANVCKSLGKEKCKGTLAEAAVSQIALIYHTDNTLSDIKAEERLQKLELLVKPLEYVLTEISKHLDETDRSFFENLLP